MQPLELMHSLQARGCVLQANGDKLRIINSDKLTDQDRVAIRAHKPALLKALERVKAGAPAPHATRTTTADTPPRTAVEPPAAGETSPFGQKELDAIRSGFGVWVWSGVLDEWLFWVRDDERKAKALTKGIDRWRIWTLDELSAAQGMPPADLRNVFELKRRFDGTVQPGDKPQRWRDALSPLKPAVAAPPDASTDAPATTVPPAHSHAHSAPETRS